LFLLGLKFLFSLLLLLPLSLLLLIQFFHPPSPFLLLSQYLLHLLLVLLFAEDLLEGGVWGLLGFAVLAPDLLIEVVDFFLHLLSFCTIFEFFELFQSWFGGGFGLLRERRGGLGQMMRTSGMARVPILR
jgi:hypothetical protein